jgi:hypothetical protein
MSTMIHPGPQGRNGGLGQRYYGKYPGLVVDRSPATSAGHHRGELVVRVPGILEEAPSGGQRPLEAVAKPCFTPGLFWVPEVGDPVWVEFAAGEIDMPIWTGVWYPAGATPASEAGDRPTAEQKVFRTPSGQVVQLDDTGGSEKLVLKDEANNNRIVLDSSGIRLEAGSCVVELGATSIRLTNGTHTLEMGATGTTLDHNGLGAQPLVLAPLLDWLQTHQHLGNMGAPTPIFPGDLLALHQPSPPRKSGS